MYLLLSLQKDQLNLTYRAVDEFSYNEMLEQKRAMVEETLWLKQKQNDF